MIPSSEIQRRSSRFVKASSFDLHSADSAKEFKYSQAVSDFACEDVNWSYRRLSSRTFGERWVKGRGRVISDGRLASIAGTRRGSLGVDVGSQNAVHHIRL
jgi:hypothetical protein